MAITGRVPTTKDEYDLQIAQANANTIPQAGTYAQNKQNEIMGATDDDKGTTPFTGGSGRYSFVKPGREDWMRDLEWERRNNLSQDPGSFNQLWAEEAGYGRSTEGRLNQWLDPSVMRLMMGGNQAMLGPDAELDFMGGLNASAFRTGDSAFSGQHLRASINQILSAKPGEGGEYDLGNELYGAAQDPVNEVANVMQFMISYLQPHMQQNTLESYINMIGRLGTEYSYREDSNYATFGDYVLAKLGPNGGL